jgi:Holliday junction resolvase
VKTIVASRSGLPDLIACYKGYFISIEVKGDSEVSALQKYNLEQIQKAGGAAIVAYDISEVVDLIEVISHRKNI